MGDPCKQEGEIGALKNGHSRTCSDLNNLYERMRLAEQEVKSVSVELKNIDEKIKELTDSIEDNRVERISSMASLKKELLGALLENRENNKQEHITMQTEIRDMQITFTEWKSYFRILVGLGSLSVALITVGLAIAGFFLKVYMH